MAMNTFVNLPVKDLAKATEFFTKLGFSFDPQFTDERATRMIISDDTSVMLQVEPFFKEFITPQDIADTSRSREVIIGLNPWSSGCPKAWPPAVTALSARSSTCPRFSVDSDLDGHQWSFIHMDMSAIPEG